MTPPLPGLACAEALATIYQEEVAEAHAALQRRDEESLHDFRVALRRLRVWVEDYAAEGKPRRQVLKRLKRLLRQTSRGRDSEVMLAWLEQVRPKLGEKDRLGNRCWQRSLQHRRHHGGLPLTRSYHRLAKLGARLAGLPLRSEFTSLTFAAAAAARLNLHAGELRSLLQEEAESGETLHQLRLKVKTLRYLLLPFRDLLPSCQACEQQMHQLQDLLGSWHDSVICRQNLARCLAKRIKRLPKRIDHALDHATPLAPTCLAPELEGLITLARLNHHREQQTLRVLRRRFLHGKGESLTDSLQQATAALHQLSAG